jgi:hypothetical protein
MLKFPDVIMNATIHIVDGIFFSFETSQTVTDAYFKEVCIPFYYVEEFRLFALLNGVALLEGCRYKFHLTSPIQYVPLY